MTFLLAHGGAALAAAPTPSGSPPIPSPAVLASPAPPPGALVPPPPGDSGTPTGLAWAAVGRPVTGDGPFVSELVTWKGGFAFADSGAPTPLLWTSADGRGWTAHPMPPTTRWAQLLATDDGLATLEQRRDPRPDVTAALAWTTTDGARWQRGSIVRIVPPDGCAAGAGRASSAGTGIVLLALTCFEPCCGVAIDHRFAMAATEAAPASPRPAPTERTIARVTRDTRTWRSAPVRLAVAGGDPVPLARLRSITDGPERLLAIPEVAPAAVLASTDGLAWTSLAPLPAGYSVWGDVWPRAVDGASTLLVGQLEDARGRDPGIWLLEPNGTWLRVVGATRVETDISGIATDGDVVVVAGNAIPNDSPGRRWAWTLVSTDGGRTFDPALGWAGPFGSCVGQVAIHDGVAVMLGCAPGSTMIWSASLPS
ncbi:MAG: hypothetical protein U0869_19885 [Chloroflexota bacterium]